MTREAEIAKYEMMYQDPTYGMGSARLVAALDLLKDGPRGPLVDVGCGRAELFRPAAELGYGPIMGTEVVSLLCGRADVRYAEIWDLPFEDRGVHTVTCFDVLEHILPEDAEVALKELWRITDKRLLLSTNARSTLPKRGIELHVNRKAPVEWHRLIVEHCAPVTWFFGPRAGGSFFWEVTR